MVLKYVFFIEEEFVYIYILQTLQLKCLCIYICLQIRKYVTSATLKSVDTNPRWYYVVCDVYENTVHPIEETPGDEEGPVMFDCLQCNRNVTEVLAK